MRFTIWPPLRSEALAARRQCTAATSKARRRSTGLHGLPQLLVCINTTVEVVSSVELPTFVWHQRTSVLPYIRSKVKRRITVNF